MTSKIGLVLDRKGIQLISFGQGIKSGIVMDSASGSSCIFPSYNSASLTHRMIVWPFTNPLEQKHLEVNEAVKLP